MIDTDKEKYAPTISDTKPETMKPLAEERMTNKALLDNIFGAGYVMKKTINDSHLSIMNYCCVQFKRLISSQICNMKKLILILDSKKVVSELIYDQDWSISYLAMCLMALGFMITFGATLMHLYFKLDDPAYLAIIVSFGIWVIIQGILTMFPSRKLLPWTIMSKNCLPFNQCILNIWTLRLSRKIFELSDLFGKNAWYFRIRLHL